ncbi:hypothetical protein VKS41_008954 [Umbelopsis sp. WA50703]|jgi:hypothetical protein
MLNIIKISAFAAFTGMAMAAPLESRASAKSITVKNNCGNTMTVGWLTNGQSNDHSTLFDLNAGASQTINPPGSNWGGRVWARDQCSHSDLTNCGTSGAVSPASLAEFLFNGAGNQDYYDVSLVDGYNIPIQITPNGKTATSQYQCGSPEAVNLPTCPSANQVTVNGKVVGCKSSCSLTGSPQDCCTGAYNTPDKCPINSFAEVVKKANPDAYSYAYDDQTSTYTCDATGYTVTFCPA